MAAVTTSNPADFVDRVQRYHNPKFLEALDYNLVLAPYGLKKAYPSQGGNATIRFFRPRAANTTGVAAISEGVTPTTLTEVAVGYVDITLSQRGALASVTDLVRREDLIDTVGLYTKTMGADAALDLDTVIRNAIRTGLNNSVQTTVAGSYGGYYFERFAGVTQDGGAAADTSAECHATMHALAASAAKFTRLRHLTNITTMKAARVPTIGGRYVAITPNEVMMDIRQDADWLAAATQVNNNALYKHGEIMLDGAVFVPTDNPWREGATYGTYSSSGANFSVFYLGEGAFGIPESSNKIAGGSQMGPRTIILAGPDKADPLGLKTLIGWKAFWGCAPFITNVAGEVPHYMQFRCKTTFGT